MLTYFHIDGNIIQHHFPMKTENHNSDHYKETLYIYIYIYIHTHTYISFKSIQVTLDLYMVLKEMFTFDFS